MRSDFCIFILTHGRAGRVITVETLRKCGYTGKFYIVIDDEDSQGDEYRKEFGDKVLMFSKEEMSKKFDEGDNFNDRRTITYARNACFELAEKVGCRYFMQLDDDYRAFNYKFTADRRYTESLIHNLDSVFLHMLNFYTDSQFLSIAFSQGGDHIGGGAGYAKAIQTKRKAMNSFLCDTQRPFKFRGRFNEDVNTYTSAQRAGGLFLTLLGLELKQKATQANDGGITELYKKFGTYVKAFMTIMYAPSCVIIRNMQVCDRIHHQVNWNATAPKIIRETHRKVCQSKKPE
jgi:hypothetical protein